MGSSIYSVNINIECLVVVSCSRRERRGNDSLYPSLHSQKKGSWKERKRLKEAKRGLCEH